MVKTPIRSRKSFIAACNVIDDAIGCTIYEDTRSPDIFEDDGYLHVRKYGIRACFDVGRGQQLDGREQNENSRTVLKELGFTPKDWTRVLVGEEDVDDDDECPTCGRGGW